MKKGCICILDKEFEDCFDDGTLVAAFSAVAGNYGLTVNLTEQNLAVGRKRGERVARSLERIYYIARQYILLLNHRWVGKLLECFLEIFEK